MRRCRRFPCSTIAPMAISRSWQRRSPKGLSRCRVLRSHQACSRAGAGGDRQEKRTSLTDTAARVRRDACRCDEGLQTINVAMRQPINPDSVASSALCRQRSELRRLYCRFEDELRCRILTVLHPCHVDAHLVGACCGGCPTKGAADRRQSLPPATAGGPARMPRPCLEDADRRFWILASRWFSGWRNSLLIVKPETVLRWHREGWRTYWRRRSRHTGRRGRRPIAPELRTLIRHDDNRKPDTRVAGLYWGRRAACQSPSSGSTSNRSSRQALGHLLGLLPRPGWTSLGNHPQPNPKQYLKVKDDVLVPSRSHFAIGRLYLAFCPDAWPMT